MSKLTSTDRPDPPGSVASTVPVAVVNPAKLRPPQATHRIVAHDRLLSLRPDPDEASVVRVVAPAGYGKTTLLAEWVHHDPGPVLWVTLDRHDDDPMTLVTHVAAAALEAGAPATELREAIRTPAASVWSVLIPRLAAALQALSPFTLALDDAHSVTSPASRDAIDWLVLNVPSGAQVLISGRSEVAPSAARLEVHGLLVSRGTQELALTDEEAHQLLLGRGMEATPDAAAQLNRLCEGWVSGLLMITLATSVHRDASDTAAPKGQGQLVDDYLKGEVLDGLTPEEQEFVRHTSVLRAASGPLCDALFERTGSQRLLERLCAANAFVTRMDDGWYSLHDLLRLALLAQFEREDGAMVASLRSRAATWHANHGSPEEALRYSLESGFQSETVRLIGSFAVVLYGLGRQATLDSWFDWIEEEDLVSSDPLTATAGSMLSALVGAPERSERWAASLARSIASRSTPLEDPFAEGYGALVEAWQCRRGAEAMLANATRACELIADESIWRKSALGAMAVAQLMNGMDAESDALLRVVTRNTGAARADTNARSVSAVFLARRALIDHDLDAARSWLEYSAELRVASGTTGQGLQAFEDAVTAQLVLALDADVEGARRVLAHAQTVRPLTTWAMPGLALPIRLELIKGHLALADVAAARVLTHEAFDILHHRPGLGAFEAEARELRERVAEQAESISGPSSLTTAELRMVPWLATHLSFREIGERLYLSTNTVKTEALATYRKLGVSSRSEAVEAAVRVGLLDPASLAGILHASSRMMSKPD